MKRYGWILGKSWLSAIGSFLTFLFFLSLSWRAAGREFGWRDQFCWWWAMTRCDWRQGGCYVFVYFPSYVFFLLRFFLVMMNSDSLWMEAGWLVWGRDQSLEESVIVLWLSSSQLPQRRLTIPNYPPSRLQLLILYSASFKSTLGTSYWPLTIFPLRSQKEKQPNCRRTLHWQFPNT